jgi:AmmeMemoRadiSam system protein A
MDINTESKKFLLKLARLSIHEFLTTGKYLNIDESTIPSDVKFKSGCFVTLKIENDLRGCIGTFDFSEYIYNNVIKMAVEAAINDPRFPPVDLKELKQIECEISVLTPLVPVYDISDIKVGRDGLYVRMGFNSGVLLPQVAVENNWDEETFISYTCLKAGLPSNTWKKYSWKGSPFEVYKFEAIVFSESMFK